MSLKYKHTIAVVDDETSITKSLQRLFRKEGYQILTASSGQEGLEMFNKMLDVQGLGDLSSGMLEYRHQMGTT